MLSQRKDYLFTSAMHGEQKDIDYGSHRDGRCDYIENGEVVVVWW
jgi:hypothetical protein